MRDITLFDLDKLHAAVLRASEYAEKNLIKLKDRQVFYTLYGADSYGMGAASPSHLIKDKERTLSPILRRKAHTRYDLDQSFRLLRNSMIRKDGSIDCVYYHFELDGIRFARAFRANDGFYYTGIHCLKLKERTPDFYAIVSPTSVYVEYYESPQNSYDVSVPVTSYLYYPTRQITEKGLPICRDAPFGTPTSPVTAVCHYERILPNINLARFFKE